MDTENTMTVPDLDYVRAQLEARKGTWPEIERETGLDYSWLAKVARGVTDDPGIKKVTRAARYFRLLEQIEADRAALLKRSVA